jgi:hypothetical protein
MKRTLTEYRDALEKFIHEKYNRNVSISIHISTDLNMVKANVQGSNRKFDIIISGSLSWNRLEDALAHEAAHIIAYNNEHDSKFEEARQAVLEFFREEREKNRNSKKRRSGNK